MLSKRLGPSDGGLMRELGAGVTLCECVSLRATTCAALAMREAMSALVRAVVAIAGEEGNDAGVGGDDAGLGASVCVL